uniref:Uncharacterized protein n=1 Tax=uncultured Elusimicrobia bacterium TaxID=699876 RepID=A0A650EN26_9BACT|nr:hypothetical protein Elusimicrob1349_0480 [uncultured Elusimicrobia bacterium]
MHLPMGMALVRSLAQRVKFSYYINMEKKLFLFAATLILFSPLQAQKIKAVRQVFKAPPSALANVPVVKTPVFAAPHFTRLSGRTLFTQLTPAWKTPFLSKFQPEHLSTVETALHKTDLALFAEQNGLLSARSNEWNYTERFALELADELEQRGLTLTPSQWKQIFGGTGVKGSTLANHLRLLTLEAWLLTHGGEYPRRQFSVNGRVLKQEELSDSQKLEQNLAVGVKWAVRHPKDETDPVFLHLKFRHEQGSRKKTPEYWLEELKMWLLAHGGEYPHSSFSHGTRVSADDLTPAQKEEAALANGVNNAISLAKDPSDPVIAELIRLKEEGKRYNSPEETLALLQEWMEAHGGRVPRASIVKNGHYLTVAELTPEELEEKRLAATARALTWGPSAQTPAALQVRAIFQNASRRKTAAQIAEELSVWMNEHQGRLPRLGAMKGEMLTEDLQQEIALGRAAINQIYRGKCNPSAQTEEIRLLWESGQSRIQRRSPEEWLEAFKTYLSEHKRYPAKGTPEYAGVRNLIYRSAKNTDGTYLNPVVQQIYELNQLALAARRGDAEWKEVLAGKGAETALKHFWREATPQDRAALQATSKEMEELREDFPLWLTDAVSSDWLVMSSQAYEALSTVRRGLDEWFDERADEADDILVWLYDTPWGKDDSADLFSRVRYVGKNPAMPRLKDFREVQEFTGIPTDRLPALPGSISAKTRKMGGDEVRVTELHLRHGVTPEELQEAVKNLLPEGSEFTVRMGMHELGISVTTMNTKRFRKGFLHLHAEAQVPDEPVILSFTLELDTRQAAAGKSFAELKRLYYKLFKPYLSEDAALFLR